MSKLIEARTRKKYKLNFCFSSILLIAILNLFVLQPNSFYAQGNEMFKAKPQKKMRKKRNKSAYNPYVDSKTGKIKRIASKNMEKENQRAIKEQKKMVRREKRKLRRQGKGYKKK